MTRTASPCDCDVGVDRRVRADVGDVQGVGEQRGDSVGAGVEDRRGHLEAQRVAGPLLKKPFLRPTSAGAWVTLGKKPRRRVVSRLLLRRRSREPLALVCIRRTQAARAAGAATAPTTPKVAAAGAQTTNHGFSLIR